ncbi:hypothetical protein BJ165DRAFT_1502314 [Panaeolus papilionaceus]|nr:hypothetical protein BJ165DRAFT_1502314 [Panaeolus papilionaceus]
MLASGNGQACALDTTCVCSNNVASGIKSCYQCSVDSKVIDQKTADNELADYENACKQAGHPVSSASSLTMSGFAAVAALSGLILL